MLLDAGADTHVRHEIFKDSPVEYAQLRGGLKPDDKTHPDPVLKNATEDQKERYRRIASLIVAAESKI